MQETVLAQIRPIDGGTTLADYEKKQDHNPHQQHGEQSKSLFLTKISWLSSISVSVSFP